VVTTTDDRANRLHIVLPTMLHNNFGLQMWGDPALVARFDAICHREFDGRWTPDPADRERKKSWGAFWQGQSEDWLYVEFWMEKSVENQDRLLAMAEKIGAEMGVPVEIG
jgi:hypothetical protein